MTFCSFYACFLIEEISQPKMSTRSLFFLVFLLTQFAGVFILEEQGTLLQLLRMAELGNILFNYKSHVPFVNFLELVLPSMQLPFFFHISLTRFVFPPLWGGFLFIQQIFLRAYRYTWHSFRRAEGTVINKIHKVLILMELSL